MALGFVLLAFPISLFYNDSVFVPLGGLLSISLFFNAINMIPNGIMNREKKFIAIAIRTIVTYALSSIISVVLAFHGFRYYAIVIQTMLSSFIIFIWNYLETKPKFKVSGCLISTKKVLNYSGYQFAFNMVNYLSRNLDNLLTGKFMGNSALGYYNKAYSLMLYPVNNLTGVISPVLHPVLSDYQSHKEIIYKKYTEIVKILSLIGVFIAPFCYFASNEIISILYGTQWEQSVKCFQILSFAILPQLVGSSAGAIYQSLGKTKLLFFNGVINTAITIIAILCGVLIGKNIIFLSICVSIAYITHFFTVYFMLIHLGFGYKFINFLRKLFPEIIILVVMMLIVHFVKITSVNVLFSFALKLIILGIVYAIMLLLTKEYIIFYKLIKRRSK